jgi:hypothetical protein
VFAMGADALEMTKDEHPLLIDQMVIMIKMLVTGAYQLEKHPQLTD